METATLLNHTDQQTHTHELESDTPQESYTIFEKLIQAAGPLQSELIRKNHFDRHIESYGHNAPHWIAWLKTV